MALYSERTNHSQIATDRARKVMPAGVPSSFQAYDPWPVVVKHASGSKMIDVDDNEYVDYDMGFGALFAGHMNPAVARRGHGAARPRDALRHAVRAQRRRRRVARRTVRPADVASDQLGHRGHDGRDPARAWCHGSREDRQGRRRLPRPPRRGDGVEQAVARRCRPRRCARTRCRSPPASPRARSTT